MRFFGRPLLPFLALLAVGCTPGGPGVPEPEWGGAQPPRPEEVTEITFEHRHCAHEQCTTEWVLFRRDGLVRRRIEAGRTGSGGEYGRVDSATFVGMVRKLNASRFFGLGGFDADGTHVPLAEDSWVISGATYCRRAVSSFMMRPDMSNGPYRVVPELDSVIHTISWKEPSID